MRETATQARQVAERLRKEAERHCACLWQPDTTGEEGPLQECPYHRDHREAAEKSAAEMRERVAMALDILNDPVKTARVSRAKAQLRSALAHLEEER